MRYYELSVVYREERMTSMKHCLENKQPVRINHLFLEEIVALKNHYGDKLKKTGGYIYLDLNEEVHF